ncbi:MAG: hypothetical protein Ct9H300mP28_36930 [Pseudomonadota bacterium]|nr:MAG: hypothetical protein Ct9H300mP28_36930 [Pseudomonadota bacterium]
MTRDLRFPEIREATDHQIPIQLKLGSARVFDDVRMALKTNPGSIYIDGMEGSTGPGLTWPRKKQGYQASRQSGRLARHLMIWVKPGNLPGLAGGIRNGADVAKALALGADAVAIGHSAMMALNCNKDIPEADYEKEMGVEAGYCYHCHTGRCPVGVATQDPELRKRLDPDKAAERVYNFLHCLAIECQMMARACGKTNVHSLEPEDLAALTMEASALAQVPLAGSQHTVGRPDMHRY